MSLVARLHNAGLIARQHSSVVDNSQVIELKVTELGLVATGTYRDAMNAFTHSMEAPWIEVDAQPEVAEFIVSEVIRRLYASALSRGCRPFEPNI